MATKSLSDFLPEVLPYVDGCPDVVAKNAVIKAAIELCERGKIWRYDLDPISIAPNIYEYDLNYPANTYVADILRAELDGVPLTGKTREDLDREYPGWQSATGEAVGYFLTTDKRKIRIVKTPTAFISNGLLVEAALKPSRAVTTLEEFIFEDHLERIGEGARWKLFEMKGMPWSSATRAEDCKKAFFAMCAAAAVDSAQSHGRTPMRTRPVYSIEA